VSDYAVIEAPSILGLVPSGVERLPAALLDAGLATRLAARHAGTVVPPPYDPVRDLATGLLNPDGLRTVARDLADLTGAAIDAGDVPLVLGGDCSIVLGPLLALRRRGRFGLLFLDGHADLYQPAAEPDGQAASMDLALATGRGPAVVTDIDGLGPLVRDADVAHLGQRDAEEADAHGSLRMDETAITAVDLAAVRAEGIEAATARALAAVARPELDGFWLHVDCDVLDDALVPAVDYRLPGGLHWDELAHVLAAARATGRLVGLEVAILNPALDPGGVMVAALADCLVSALGPP
jgi:arginase